MTAKNNGVKASPGPQSPHAAGTIDEDGFCDFLRANVEQA
jgi:hypothetical protein